MKKNKETERTVAALLGFEKEQNFKERLFSLKEEDQPDDLHRYIYCRSKAIAKRFLRDAEAEGFTIGGMPPTKCDTSDIFALSDDFTICYSGFAGHMAFCQGGERANIIRIDYGKYIAGEKEFYYKKERK